MAAQHADALAGSDPEAGLVTAGRQGRAPLGSATASRSTPWRPAKLVVSPAKRSSTVTRPRGPILGPPKLDATGVPALDARGNPKRERLGWRTPGKEVACWDLTFYVDGWEYFERFAKAGLADSARLHLEAGFAGGLLFDPATKRFVDSLPEPIEEAPARPAPATVYTEAVLYMSSKWQEWEPKTRREGAKALRRACIQFVPPDAPPPGAEARHWLDWILKAPSPSAAVPPEVVRGEEYWVRWSAPIAGVTSSDLQALLQRYRVNERDPSKLTSPDTERRFVADLRQFWNDAESRLEFRNPWPKVKLRTKGKSGRRSAATGPRGVDPETVLSMPAVWWLAAACGHQGAWGPGVAGYVLMMGVCGLRPGEAAGVRIDDLELPPTGPGWVKVRRSRREVAEHWLDPDEDRVWGPLKDRDLTDSRRVPIPGALVRYFRDVHIPRYCADPRRGLLFERNGRPYEQGPFSREVWVPARDLVLPSDPELAVDDPQQPPLSRLRRHDLRHAACSMWLNTPNVDIKVAQRWSGHRTLSVFLDIYQGVMPGRETEGALAVHDTMP